MKRKILLVSVFFVFAALLISCAVAPYESSLQCQDQQTTTTPVPLDPLAEKISPSAYLLSSKYGDPAYGIYEYDDENGRHCVIIADVTVNLDDFSNTAPSIDCE